MYLPGTPHRWHLGILRTPDTYPGGARDVLIRWSSTNGRTVRTDDARWHEFVWVEITSKSDPYYARGQRFYAPDEYVHNRK